MDYREALEREAIRLERIVMKVKGASWEVPWRVGRKVGRTIYAQRGEEASDDDALIGLMDTPRLAQEAIEAHNKSLRQ